MAALNDASLYTSSSGRPVANPATSQTLGRRGPILLQDTHLIDLLAHFGRERIPERVVHAKGAGAFGEFVVTHDCTDICSADLFSHVDKTTPVAARFSTVGGESGSADAARDPRGFAIKFYTEEGNWDMVGNNTPIFFIRDGAKFPLFIHSQKRNPQTHLKDATIFWDFLSSNQETIHQTMFMFTDRGTPLSYRHQNTYSAHTFKFTTPDGKFKYVKLHFLSDQGNKTMTDHEAAAADPDHATQDLFEAIDRGEFPSWTLKVQVLDPSEAEDFRWNIFDVTKVWPHDDVPLREIGRLTLNRNALNYFAEIEQLAFAPSHLVPGIEATVDPMLQARLFSYADSQRYRLGANYHQIPVNAPKHPNATFQRDGFMAVQGNYGSAPNYPSTIRPVQYAPPAAEQHHETWTGQAIYDLQEVSEEDYVQANMLWEMLVRQEGEQEKLVGNVARHLCQAAAPIRARTYEMFRRVDGACGRWVEEMTEGLVKGRILGWGLIRRVAVLCL